MLAPETRGMNQPFETIRMKAMTGSGKKPKKTQSAPSYCNQANQRGSAQSFSRTTFESNLWEKKNKVPFDRLNFGLFILSAHTSYLPFNWQQKHRVLKAKHPIRFQSRMLPMPKWSVRHKTVNQVSGEENKNFLNAFLWFNEEHVAQLTGQDSLSRPRD